MPVVFAEMRGMQTPDNRAAVGELARDLAWLEEHCRQQPALATHAGSLRLASALARNVIGPALEGQPAVPLHIAVVGGAGAGKSTIVNFLAGAVVAESNPQAGFTRHPTAFLPANAPFHWPSTLGFLGQLTRIGEEKPANLDEDVYQVRRIAAKDGADPLASFAIWDCPDMTTWAAANYATRLLEVAALADVVVYVASDERYNDEVPTQFLHLLIRAGKAVVVVLTKMREPDADAMIAHFRQVILGSLPKMPDGSSPAVPVLAFPNMPADVRADPAGAGSRFRVALLNQVLVQCESEAPTRKRTVSLAAKYLAAAGDGLLDVARRDLAEFDAWRAAVHSGRVAFEERYRNEYLSGEQFRRFDRYRERLMDLLELPGAGRLFGNIMWVLRLPYRLFRDYVIGMLMRPAAPNTNEQSVLSDALVGWLAALQTEALRKADAHPMWKTIARGFESGLGSQIRDRFQHEFRSFELQETDDLDRAGQQLVDSVEKHPAVLGTLRVFKVAADAVAVILVIYFTWFPSWYHLLLIPLAVSVTHQVAELLTRGAAEAARARVRRQRESLVASVIAGPIEQALADWPATGGSSFERLQQVLRNVPHLIRQLCDRVTNQ
jgi:energy-coupling factor transporter ATP-binding protein EcfA2